MNDLLAAALNEIAALRELEEDWDVQGAMAVHPTAIALASSVVTLAYAAAQRASGDWRAPNVGPLSDGGVGLTWGREGRRLFMICRPGDSRWITCVTKEGRGRPFKQMRSIDMAARLAVWAISDE